MVYDYVRVYFNAKADPSRAWSVDTGPGTEEHQTRMVLIDYGTCSCWTETDFEADNVNQPKAWIRIPAARIKIKPNYIEIY